MMAGYSVLRFYPVEVMLSFKLKKLEIGLPNLWLRRGCAMGRSCWMASALDVVYPEGKGKGTGCKGSAL